MENRQIALNQGTCLNCGEKLISHHRHDYILCSCESSSLDGGTSYVRCGGDIKLETVYADEPFEKVRLHAERGGRGVNGDEPLTWTKICDMNDDWLEAVLDYGGADWHLDLIRMEINYRKNLADKK